MYIIVLFFKLEINPVSHAGQSIHFESTLGIVLYTWIQRTWLWVCSQILICQVPIHDVYVCQGEG